MRLPPQLQNILRSGVTIEHCPSCQRLIYAAELMKD
jgi:predicted  nucleic acid-binding Zn-ribbon protein